MQQAQKQKRLASLRKLIASGELVSQADAVEGMRRAGFSVTQPSVSRDLRELGVVKRDGAYWIPDARESEIEERGVDTWRLLRSLEGAGPHLLVIRTAPGGAQVVAAAIDGSAWSEVVGTIAGDDTVFVATRSKRGHQALAERLGISFGRGIGVRGGSTR